MRLQISTRLALYAALQLAADPSKQFAAAEIAERFDISVNHLAKVLRTLGRAGLVEAVRGAGGGYRFRGNVKRVTLMDVVQLFEDLGANGRGDDEPGAASEEGRALRRVLDEIDDIARATLSSITLATMLKLVREGRDARTEPPEDRLAGRVQRSR
ncbi:MAG TPA: Rrf2 family transcriptional regulator [Anaeromyxobacteraceae bacterium]|nr:Rrf2 family transcriptional regulator [Anaeromyxobacteraceae bacterium]